MQTIGLLLHDAASYGDVDAARNEFGLSGDIGVQSLARGSPADLAGLRVNDTIIAIAGSPITQAFPPSRPRWKRVSDIRDYIDKALLGGPVSIAWRTPQGQVRQAEIAGVSACRSHFELVDEARTAQADGDRVMFGQNFPAFGYGEDEFAAAIAHELAHNLLAHLEVLEELGRKQSNIRLSERDADRLMPWLLANASYDPEAAVRFMATWGPRYGGGLLRKRTHDGWDERVEYIQQEIAILEQSSTAEGKADWKTHFRSMLGARDAD
ncbi:MAG: PDZ domain-containing protein [Erythrobacter sp.]